ncbi:UNVERIFIED_CONTAM: hypothetical protein Slati_2541600 [Sesamum latifolium]|uniref:DUF4283 domain-containing protein n=1 Tax=Sesamum latifolium TaxID=2727402 RepID=A0AAW2WH83_9LAMI
MALVGKFSHGEPPYSRLHKLLASTGIKGGFTVTGMNPRHILITLSNEADYARLWTKHICFLEGFPMRIFKRSPTFNPKHESTIVPIWVGLPDLPAHLLKKAALYHIAKLIGTPLQSPHG